MKRLIKALHEVGAIGSSGAFAALLVLVAVSPNQPLLARATAYVQIAAVEKWLLVPSLGLVLISGLLSIAATRAFHSAGWAWVKALLGISIFEGTLLTVVASGRHAAELATLAVSGQSDSVEITQLIYTETGGLWIMLVLSVSNVVLAVWRPKFSWRPRH